MYFSRYARPSTRPSSTRTQGRGTGEHAAQLTGAAPTSTRQPAARSSGTRSGIRSMPPFAHRGRRLPVLPRIHLPQAPFEATTGRPSPRASPTPATCYQLGECSVSCVLCRRFDAVEHVSGAAYGAYEVARRADLLQLAADATDVLIEDPVVDLVSVAPDLVGDLLRLRDPASVVHKDVQKGELGSVQFDLRIAGTKLISVQVEADATDGQQPQSASHDHVGDPRCRRHQA